VKSSNSSFEYFIKNPSFDFKKEISPLILKYKQFLIFDLKIILIYGLLLSLMYFLFEDFKTLFNNRINLNYTSFDKLLLFVIVAPIIEETAFRLGLKINKKNVAISFGFQLIVFLGLLDIINYSLGFRVVLMLATSCIFYFLINNVFLDLLKKHFNYFFYYNILMFGIAHASNYIFDSSHQYYFIPVIIFFPLAMGAYLSYSRLRYRFSIALSFHVLHNLVSVLITLLITNV
jgi:hypothetical protein